MKKLLVIVFALNFVYAKAQEDFKYHAQFDLGVGATIFNVPSSLNIDEKSGAFATAFKFDATAEVKKHFSIGLGITFNKYATETDSLSTFIEAKSPVILFLANYHLIDKKKINFCIGTGVGVNGLNYERTFVQDSVVVNGKVRTEGPAYSLHTQLRYYFTKNIGLFFRTQYIVNGGQLKSLIVNGEKQARIDNKPIEDVFFSFRGVSVSLGLSFRF